MIGRQERWQEDLFVAAPLRDLIPEDHILKRVDRVLDLSWLRDEVRDCYDETNGRPGIDPEAAMRLMLAGLFHGITRDRKLLREAQVNIAMRWFCGYRLTDELPHHSSMTTIRQRWGPQRFETLFKRSVEACGKAGLIDGETVHIDAMLIRADVSWESLAQRHVEAVLRDNDEETDGEDDPPQPKRGRPRSRTGKPKKYSRTDPDATMATSCRQQRMEPCYKQHAAVDDRAGVIVDVHVTTGEASEGRQLPEQIDRIEMNTGTPVRTVTADAGYAHARNYGELEDRRIRAVIPPQPVRTPRGRIPARRFKYDGTHKLVRCPAGKKLRFSSRVDEHSSIYRARTCDCRKCPQRACCFAPSASARVIRIADRQAAQTRARRRHARGDASDHHVYARHRWRAEGMHGEEKTQHGFRRAARRGLNNVRIQANLTATVINLKRLAASACAHFQRLVCCMERCRAFVGLTRSQIQPQRTPLAMAA